LAKSEFGASWWAQRWIAVLESFGWADRLARGRSYARYGAVRKIEITPGEVQARVQGSLSSPYRVRIAVRPLSNREWDAAIAAMGGQAIFAAQLLAGEMPPTIEEAFAAARTSLFPTAADLATDCTCPDPANPCKHIAAVYYTLGTEFDRDPFLIFRLRGRERDAILAALRELRAAAVAAEPAPAEEPAPAPIAPLPPPPLTPGPEFWQMQAPLDEFRVEIAAPPRPAALIERLGPPPFWQPPAGFLPLMSAVYAQVTEEALKAAFGGEEPD
jgi:uncharacterized Zn finger protein